MFLLPLCFYRIANEYDTAARTGNGALNGYYVLLGVNLGNTEVLNRYSLVTVLARHLLILENSRGA